jgi:hypothetical protein
VVGECQIFKKDSPVCTAFLETQKKVRQGRTHSGQNGGVGGAENFFRLLPQNFCIARRLTALCRAAESGMTVSLITR